MRADINTNVNNVSNVDNVIQFPARSPSDLLAELPCGICGILIMANQYSPHDGDGNPICMPCSERCTTDNGNRYGDDQIAA